MRRQSRQHVMRVLPHGFGDDERRVGIEGAEDIDALALTGDEAVLILRLVRMGAPDDVAFGGHRRAKRRLHGGLRRPADLVGGQTKVAAGDELHGSSRVTVDGHEGDSGIAGEEGAEPAIFRYRRSYAACDARDGVKTRTAPVRGVAIARMRLFRRRERAGRERTEDRGSERRALSARVHGDPLAEHVGVDLDDQRVVVRKAAGRDELPHRHAAIAQQLDDPAQAEAPRLRSARGTGAPAR